MALNTDSVTNLMTQLWNQGQSSGGGLEELFADLSRQLLGSQGKAEEAQTALSQGTRDLPTQMDPIAQALITAAGSASSMFTGSERGRETAKTTIEGENQRILQARKESLASLGEAYTRAADRAEKMGDLETSMKFKTKYDSTLQKQENINKILMTGIEQENRREITRLELTGRERLAGLEAGARGRELQTRFGQDVVLANIREQGDQRTAYIAQGLDPNDPTKPLTGSKAQRIAQSRTMGFLSTSGWTNEYSGIVNAARQGKPNFKGDKLRNRLLAVAPDETFAADPDRWYDFLKTLPDPNKRDVYLFPRDSRNPNIISPAYTKRIIDYMERYWPDWNPSVMAPDSVGR